MGTCSDVPPTANSTANIFKANNRPEGEMVCWQEKDGFKQIGSMEVSRTRSQG